jgi:hypothetical protein
MYRSFSLRTSENIKKCSLHVKRKLMGHKLISDCWYDKVLVNQTNIFILRFAYINYMQYSLRAREEKGVARVLFYLTA